ncbi:MULTISPECIES: phosphohistidine phosphatase SixA [Pseudomonas]|jgi:phosphohistidine phosphatase|uniref:Phosphohistidine phosphatase SixA n=1 Tax=Pseudomonas gregormendelii TaxID=1628277 RepID=A0ABS3AK73_9PSED|nr:MULTISPECIES: phosphohistidine phosphatase SixA [Pseudomonas]KJH74495.1 phosphohistidine phosphatase [Pseudomonas sp. ES3-33]MBK5517602.1 phosphohistidine phosphatase SixA [Pseudomonas sp. TH10]MBN3967395.1 phosphohistidine phosphatase SixA [Pseudomonas gregormendelii]MCA4965318.1 phosphohistidine phosphatase SixA [Pseudomonas sp. Y24-6]MCH4880522.1 phosphohistidine phosphatase SixA [Pseudomonas sp. TMW22090]
MKLWVLRHGEAEPHGTRPDSERELTASGRAEVLRSAALLISEPLTAIYASPFKRAQQTAELVREALGFKPDIRTVDWLTPDSRPQAVAEQLVSVDYALLVSHNPLVGNLLGYLQHGHVQDPERVSTAGLAELEGDLPLAGAMKLNSIKHP